MVYTDTRKAGLTEDDLACSVNYGDVSRDILKFFQNNTFKLIETVAEKLAQELLLRYDLAEKSRCENRKTVGTCCDSRRQCQC